MQLRDTYKQVLPSVVAIAVTSIKTHGTAPPVFPPIIGTGFVVAADGVVATNRHVADAIDELAANGSTCKCMLFVPGFENEKSTMRVTLVDIVRRVVVAGFVPGDRYYGDLLPDIAFLRLRVRDLPSLELAREPFYVQPGDKIATAGFPLGEAPLTALGNRPNQMIPFVRKGIVSSVLPFPIENPQGLTIDIMQQGGSSGSPIFREHEAVVVGMMAGSILDPEHNGANTNISVCVPSGQISDALTGCIEINEPLTPIVPTLTDHLAARPGLPMGFCWDTIRNVG